MSDEPTEWDYLSDEMQARIIRLEQENKLLRALVLEVSEQIGLIFTTQEVIEIWRQIKRELQAISHKEDR